MNLPILALGRLRISKVAAMLAAMAVLLAFGGLLFTALPEEAAARTTRNGPLLAFPCGVAYDVSDIFYVRERLFRAPNDRLFIARQGGAATAYDDGAVEPVSRAQAVHWLEAHGGDDVIVEEFPDLVEQA